MGQWLRITKSGMPSSFTSATAIEIGPIPSELWVTTGRKRGVIGAWARAEAMVETKIAKNADETQSALTIVERF
jgi:hypothetical protein